MTENLTILLAIRTLGYQGGNILGNRWLPLVYSLRQLLAKTGMEDQASSDECLLFTFPHPFFALTTLWNSLEKVKEEYGWKESQGKLPIQIVLHLVQQEDTLPQIRETTAPEWDLLQQETVYITRPLKLQWDELMHGRELPEHSFEVEGDGFYSLIFAQKASLQTRELFSYRALPVRGELKECFYCGMTNHVPANCPSKFLSMKIQGLQYVGYLSFTDLNAIYKKIFPDYTECGKRLAAGAKPVEVRKDKELLVFTAYLDIYKIYQLRFLWNISFNLYSKWEMLDRTDKVNIDSRSLHMALDCLRVGQYERAEELFSLESRRRDGKQFFASVGLAFWALEQRRNKDMGHYLERAKNLASQEKERLYIQLLLSRYYELQKDSWKAKEALNNAIKIHFDSLDCQYRKLQQNVRIGFGEDDLKRLRSLMMGQKEVFMSAILDPSLLPIQGLVNNLALEQIYNKQREAAQNLAMAEAEFAEMRYWFDEQDHVIQENLASLDRLRKKFKRQSYYDLLDVADRAQAIAYACKRIRKEKVEELEEEIKREGKRWQAYHDFWNLYRYKSLFKAYSQSLVSIGDAFKEIRELMEKNEGRAFRKAEEKLAGVKVDFTVLKELYGKMVMVNTLINGIGIFVKNLLISEISLLVAGAVLFLVVPLALGDSPMEGLMNLLSDADFRRKSILTTALFLAPMLALSWTVWKLKDTN